MSGGGTSAGIDDMGGSSDGPETPEVSCVETSQEVGDDEATEFGATVNEVLERYGVNRGDWRCELHWGALDGQDQAQWNPHDTSVIVTQRLRRDTGRGRVVLGKAPPGTRLACPPRLEIGVLLEVSTSDEGLSDAWRVIARYAPWSDDLTITFDPHVAGGFSGSYDFELSAPRDWETASTRIQVSYWAGAMEGALVESATRETPKGIQQGGSNVGEGFVVRSAAWQCPPDSFLEDAL